jgi:hypothetical protein
LAVVSVVRRFGDKALVHKPQITQRRAIVKGIDFVMQIHAHIFLFLK